MAPDSKPDHLKAVTAPSKFGWELHVYKHKMDLVWNWNRLTVDFLTFTPTFRDGSAPVFGGEIDVPIPKKDWGRLLADLRTDAHVPVKPVTGLNFGD